MYFLLLLLQASTANAESFLPANNLHLQDKVQAIGNIEPQQFDALIDQVVDTYQPYVREFGAVLKVVKLWQSPMVNALAKQDGNTWSLKIFGGLARRPEVTPDGFTIVVCHELGHHLGGFPFKETWAASEGQADYFAIHSCARTIWASAYEENAKHRLTVDATAKAKCDAVYSRQEDQDLCYRLTDAGKSLTALVAALKPKSIPASYATPEKKMVQKTFVDHSPAQCRLDTFLAAALCQANFDPHVIPGKGNLKGQNSLDAEQESARYICTASGGYLEGLRPGCWFKARL